MKQNLGNLENKLMKKRKKNRPWHTDSYFLPNLQRPISCVQIMMAYMCGPISLVLNLVPSVLGPSSVFGIMTVDSCKMWSQADSNVFGFLKQHIQGNIKIKDLVQIEMRYFN